MLTHYLLTPYRSLSRHRLYAAINVASLALGTAVFLVLMLVVRFETSFERWIPHADQIYTIETYAPGLHIPPTGWSPGVLLDALRSDYPGLIGARSNFYAGTVRQGDKVTSENIEKVDPTYFDVFELPFIAGSKSTALNRPDEVVLTESKAKQYFGSAAPLGRSITLEVDSVVRTYRVAGVLKDFPANTDMTFSFIIPLDVPTKTENPAWYSFGNVTTETDLRLPSVQAAQSLNNDFDRFFDRHAGKALPAPAHKTIYLRAIPETAAHLFDPPGTAVVAAVAAIAGLTLLLAAVNYINVATARSGLRAREVALRKVMGATQWTLIAQFLAESTATAALGVLLGLAICELALPSIDAAIGLKLQIDYLNDPVLDALLVLTVLSMGVVAGLYPASVLARFQPAAVLASAKAPGGGRAGSRVREALVAFQFAIAVTFSIGAAVIVSQTLYVRKADLGFRREGLIIVTSSNASGLGGDATHRALLASWRATPGVLSAGEVSSTPGSMMAGFGKLKRAGATGDGLPISINRMGPDAFETLGARLIAGRLPDRAHGEDFPVISPPNPPTGAPEPPWPKVLNSVLNARAVRALGFRDARDAVGADLVFSGGAPMTLHVIGVVQDIKLDSPREVLPPSLYFGERGPIAFSRVVVRYAAADPRPIIDRIAADWRRIVPTAQPFEAKTMDQALAPYYHTDDQISGMLGAAAVLAVLIGCVGLYGLASFNTARRVKEIGIRKTLGASTGDILKLLVGQFLRPVVVANLFAWPLAWWAMTSYLSGFDQRIALTPAYFLAATALTLLIAVGTVAGQAYAVARAEPAKALRHE